MEGICERERVRDVEWFVLSDGVWDERELRGETERETFERNKLGKRERTGKGVKLIIKKD